jgi:hypothetical protein
MPLSDMGPVFLFDVGMIVFMISPASGYLNGLFSFSKMPKEMIVKELGPVIGIEAEQRKREEILDIFYLLQDS